MYRSTTECRYRFPLVFRFETRFPPDGVLSPTSLTIHESCRREVTPDRNNPTTPSVAPDESGVQRRTLLPTTRLRTRSKHLSGSRLDKSAQERTATGHQWKASQITRRALAPEEDQPPGCSFVGRAIIPARRIAGWAGALILCKIKQTEVPSPFQFRRSVEIATHPKSDAPRCRLASIP